WYKKGVFLFNDKQFPAALECFQKARDHEIVVYEKSTKGANFAHNLYLTYEGLFITQVELADYKGALESVRLRIKLTPPRHDKHLDAVKNLTEVYRKDEKQLPAILALLDEAFVTKMLEVERVRTVQGALMDLPEVRKLIRKHEKN